jgi:hypothetical protein
LTDQNELLMVLEGRCWEWMACPESV